MADTKISALTAASTPLAGTEVLPIVQSGATVKVANNDLRPKQIQSNATSGVLQIAGPAASATRVMTTPDANFTAARTDAAQTFSGAQTFNTSVTATPNSVSSQLNSYLINFGGTDYYSGQVELQDSVGRTLVMRSPSGLINGQIGTSSNQDLNLITGGTARLSIGTNANVTVETGNFVIGTAAKGINFTANTPAAGMTSQLLNWYEEGTWTVQFYDAGSGGNVSPTTGTGYYTRVGRQVTASFGVSNISTSGMTAGNAFQFTLPFTAATTIGNSCGSCALEQFTFPSGRTMVVPYVTQGNARGFFRASGTAVDCSTVLVSQLSTGVSDIEICTITYFV